MSVRVQKLAEMLKLEIISETDYRTIKWLLVLNKIKALSWVKST